MGERGIMQIRFDELDVDELFWGELEASEYAYCVNDCECEE